MLGDALAFPRRSDDWIQTFLIGAALIPLSLLVLPAFVLQGYMVRVMQAAARGTETAPSFTDWRALFVDGLKLAVVGFVVSLVINIPVWILQFTVLSGDPSAGVSALFWVVLLLVLVVSLAVAYVLPAAYANFALEDAAFGAAFDVSTVWAGATTAAYAKAWLLAVVVGVVLGGIAAALSIALVGLPLLFYVQVAVYYLTARGFAEGLGVRDGSPGATPAATRV
ncbi:DUF4013 domain-containing protein [Halobium salinum]|uniref:DUF4013 domain-containing protein n=1 Tax=Halobium salinum TaxID=1364940 RepID=A0ABD5PDP5_9EURY|nr:DUF4013 domain-containing protein [Halobium salinum]